eukprot:scaffold3389_cov119-Cylindrotheca_fusiformis.AAC.11
MIAKKDDRLSCHHGRSTRKVFQVTRQYPVACSGQTSQSKQLTGATWFRNGVALCKMAPHISLSGFIGKSTTLTALGGAISLPNSFSVHGNITYYDEVAEKRDVLRIDTGRVAWLQQHDSFFSMLTVKETLEMAAFLELPLFTEKQRKARVRATMDSLGLRKIENRAVGGPPNTNKGSLSGGEQRRLSLARELISSPKLFIGDEPTSGLVSMHIFSLQYRHWDVVLTLAI